MSDEYLEGRIVCIECLEIFDTIEGNSSGLCSVECADAYGEREDLSRTYEEAGAGAPLYPGGAL